MGLRNRVPGNIWGAYWQCVVNMTELFMCSDNVALCQITLTMLVVVLIVSPRKLSRGIMESPAYVCLSGCLSVTTITK